MRKPIEGGQETAKLERYRHLQKVSRYQTCMQLAIKARHASERQARKQHQVKQLTGLGESGELKTATGQLEVISKEVAVRPLTILIALRTVLSHSVTLCEQPSLAPDWKMNGHSENTTSPNCWLAEVHPGVSSDLCLCRGRRARLCSGRWQPSRGIIQYR